MILQLPSSIEWGNYKMGYSLQDILANVEQIRQAIYGEEVRGSISDSIEMMAYETDTIQTFKDTVNAQLESFNNQYIQDFTGFKQEVTTTLADYKSTYESDFRNHKVEVQNQIDAFTTNINDRFTAYQSEMNKQYSEFSTGVNQTLKEYKDQNDLFEKTITERVTKFETDVNARIEAFTTSLTEEMTTFTASITKTVTDFTTEVNGKLEGYEKEIGDHKTEITNILAQYQQQLGETIIELHQSVDEKLAQNTTELENIKKEIEDKLAEASQNDPNLELVDAREGEATLKENLNKNYVKNKQMKEYVADEITKVNIEVDNKLSPINTEITDLKTTTQDLGGRTNKIEKFINEHENPVMTVNEVEPNEEGNVTLLAQDIKNSEGSTLEDLLEGARGADQHAREDIMDIKIKLKEKLAIDFINKSGIGFYDTFENTEYIKSLTAKWNQTNTTIEFASTESEALIYQAVDKTDTIEMVGKKLNVGDTIKVGDKLVTIEEVI